MQIFEGDCIEVMKTLPDNSVDSIVTDPPYELGFMGKKWDSTGIAFNVEVWQQCLRVLKPGGHLLAFSGSRTYHRMAVAIEDAGFDIRDQIMWIYGSGFPKSLDISKAIDKRRDDDADVVRVARQLKELLQISGKRRTELDEIFGTANVSQYWFSPDRRPEIVPAHRWPTVKDWLRCGDELDAEIWRLNGRKGEPGEAWDEREVIGTKKSGIANTDEGPRHTIGASKAVEVNITAPATAEAKQWQGWGTALKPAHEPIVMARKPVTATVAANVLEWGVGGLNIDGTRVGAENVGWSGAGRSSDAPSSGASQGGSAGGYNFAAGEPRPISGRWPANVIHDGSDEVVELFPDTKSGSGNKNVANRDGLFGKLGKGNGEGIGGDSGSAARFFYCAKASKRDRNEGLDEKANQHPTVKPTDLMAYLCRLVTPKGGTVLDPFMGSGSTGKAAMYEGLDFIGIEQNSEYIEIAKARINYAAKKETLF